MVERIPACIEHMSAGSEHSNVGSGVTDQR